MRTASFAVVFCFLAVLSSAVPAPAAEPTFGDTTDVVVVEVPVQVLQANGEPVRGLTASDFEIVEGRKKHPLVGFEVFDLALAPEGDKDGWKEVPVAARRHFLLLFDLTFSSPKALAKAREAAFDLVEGLHAADLVAVSSYSPYQGPKLLLGFTSDPNQIRAALTSLSQPDMFNRPDPLRLVLAEPGAGPGAFSDWGGAAVPTEPGEKPDLGDAIQAAMMSNITNMQGAVQNERERPDRIELQKNVTLLARSFGDLARMMSAVSGRKYVVYLSEGFDTSVLQGTANVDEQNEMAAATEQGDLWNIDSEKRSGSTKVLGDVEEMLEEFRRADCVIQSVDIAGLREGNAPEAQWAGGKDSLFMLARDTGGELYENLNDLSAAMDKMLKRTSLTYVLSFQPDGLARDGSYHRVKVALKNGARGTRVVHRPGYYAPRPFAKMHPTERMLAAAQLVMGGEEQGTIGASVLAAAFTGGGAVGGGRSYIPVLVEINGPSLLNGVAAGKPLPAEIYAYALDDAGKVQDFFTQTIGLDLAKVEPALRQSGLKFYGHLDLAPGRYSLRVLVRNGVTGAVAVKVLPLQVSGEASTVLLPPFFPEAPGKWLMVRETVNPLDTPVPYPFLHGEEPYIPASLPALGAGEESRLALVGYNLRPGELHRHRPDPDRRRPGGRTRRAPAGRAPGARRRRRGPPAGHLPRPPGQAGGVPAAGHPARRRGQGREQQLAVRGPGRFVRAVLAVLAVPLVLAGAPAPAAPQTFSDKTEVVVVEVPVQVLEGGEPVRGLTAADFEVYEGRTKHPVVGFEVLDLTVPAAGSRPAAPVQVPIAARRHFLMFFDLGQGPRAFERSRLAALEVMEKFHASDLVAVGAYSPERGAELHLGFTPDLSQVRAAIDRVSLPTLLDRHGADPLRLAIQPWAESGGAGVGGGGGGGGILAEAVGEAMSSAPTGPTPEFESARTQRIQDERAVVAMSRAYAELARLVASVRGRKYVLLFSEGFDSSLLSGTASVDEQNAMASAAMAGEYWNIDSSRRYGATGATSGIETMLEDFRRADCVIQAIDSGGLREGAAPESQWAGGRDSLFLMARETGGELYENFNNLGVALEKMLHRTSVTYVLAIQPERIQRDGSYHKVRVELKNAARGTRVVHRPGYYAPRPFDEQSPMERALSAGEQILAGVDKGLVPTAVLAAPFGTAGAAGAGGKAYVPVLIEVDGPALLAGTPDGTLPADVFVYAFDAENRILDYFSQRIGLEVDKVGKALRQTGLKFFGHLDLPPGEHSVRVLVRNGRSGASGLTVTTVSVPDLAQASPVLLPPFFPEPADKWLIVRETPRPGDRQVPYPFMLGEEPFIPASRPVLEKGREARLSLVGYHLRAGRIEAQARILTADGREAGEGGIARVERLGRGEDGADRLAATFAPPRNLQPGEYLLMITLSDPQGVAGISVAPFTVGGAS